MLVHRVRVLFHPSKRLYILTEFLTTIVHG